ncbi:MAG: PilN domain-containing protein [candidate division Zixibacteria bacterium]|nr:PilN domain-containing protein [candidate division Zixibacteria bacterium]
MMVQINLLPKRLRKSSRRFEVGKPELFTIVAAVVLILAMVGLTWTQNGRLASLNDDIQEAQRRATLLNKDIQLVDALMDMKIKIAERMQAVERLDRHRSAWVRILEDITRRVPDFVWLTSFAEVDTTRSRERVKKPVEATDTITIDGLPIQEVEIEGFSFTLNAVAAFMIKLMRSNFFDQVDLVYAREMQFEERQAFNFKLQGRIHYLSDDELKALLATERELKLLSKK